MVRRTSRIDRTTAQDVYRFRREEFLEDYWRYGESGEAEHATFIARTRAGKTTLAFQCLARSTRVNLEMGSRKGERIAIVLVMKPKDKTPARLGEQNGYKRIDQWPPPVHRLQRRYNIRRQPPGYLVWPKLGNLKTDNQRLRVLFERVLVESYAQAAGKNAEDRIIFADEIIGLQRLSNKDHPIVSHLNDIYERGAGMGLGLWAALQRPFNAPQNAFEQSTHLFLWRDTDRRNRQRYVEIGGIDAEELDGIVTTLRGRDCLYINRSLDGDREFYVVGAD